MIREQSEKTFDTELSRILGVLYGAAYMAVHRGFTMPSDLMFRKDAYKILIDLHHKAIAQARHKDGEDYKDRPEKVVVEAQTIGVVWAISLLDELQISSEGGEATDQLFKMLKNTISDCYKAEAGIDPTPFMNNYDSIALARAKRRAKQKDSM